MYIQFVLVIFDNNQHGRFLKNDFFYGQFIHDRNLFQPSKADSSFLEVSAVLIEREIRYFLVDMIPEMFREVINIRIAIVSDLMKGFTTEENHLAFPFRLNGYSRNKINRKSLVIQD